MANELTGDFDVVAEFSIAAANRVLAAMHATERLPHSMTLRVDDNPPPGPKAPPPSIVGAVDAPSFPRGVRRAPLHGWRVGDSARVASLF